MDVLPGGLVSFDFLLTAFLESCLSLFLDTQDTSVSVPGEKERKIFKVETDFLWAIISSKPLPPRGQDPGRSPSFS